MDNQENACIRYYRNRCLERFTANVPGAHPHDPAIGSLIDRYLYYAEAEILAGGVLFEAIDEGVIAYTGLPWVMVYSGSGMSRTQLNRWLHGTVAPFRDWVSNDPDYSEMFRWDGKLRVVRGGRQTRSAA